MHSLNIKIKKEENQLKKTHINQWENSQLVTSDLNISNDIIYYLNIFFNLKIWKTQLKYEDTDRLKVESYGTRKMMAQWLIVHTKDGCPSPMSSSLQQTVMLVPDILTPLLSSTDTTHGIRVHNCTLICINKNKNENWVEICK